MYIHSHSNPIQSALLSFLPSLRSHMQQQTEKCKETNKQSEILHMSPSLHLSIHHKLVSKERKEHSFINTINLFLLIHYPRKGRKRQGQDIKIPTGLRASGDALGMFYVCCVCVCVSGGGSRWKMIGWWTALLLLGWLVGRSVEEKCNWKQNRSRNKMQKKR